MGTDEDAFQSAWRRLNKFDSTIKFNVFYIFANFVFMQQRSFIARASSESTLILVRNYFILVSVFIVIELQFVYVCIKR